MKFLVTGGAGFIGSHLCDLLIEDDHEVIAIDDLSNGQESNLHEDIQFTKGDIRDFSLLQSLSQDCDAIFHQAAVADIQISLSQPKLVNQVNIGGTLNVLEAARRNDIPHVVFASSSSIYGEAKPPISEETRPDPKSPYALTKLVGEHYLRIYAQIYGINCVALRYFNVYGPRQKPGPVIPSFISRAKSGEPLFIYGDGSQTRDFVYVKDVACANLAALSLTGFHTLNIGTGQPITVSELADMVVKGVGGRLEQKPSRPAEAQDSWADITLAQKRVGWNPQTGIGEGLAETLNSF